jgi:hypothetical protein
MTLPSSGRNKRVADGLIEEGLRRNEDEFHKGIGWNTNRRIAVGDASVNAPVDRVEAHCHSSLKRMGVHSIGP